MNNPALITPWGCGDRKPLFRFGGNHLSDDGNRLYFSFIMYPCTTRCKYIVRRSSHDQIPRNPSPFKPWIQPTKHCLQLQCFQKDGNKVLKKAQELDISWPISEIQTDAVLAELFFPSTKSHAEGKTKRMPDFPQPQGATP